MGSKKWCVVFGLWFLVGCGGPAGEGGVTSASSLEVTSQVSVVDAKKSGSAASLSVDGGKSVDSGSNSVTSSKSADTGESVGISVAKAVSDFPSDSDYRKDVTDVFTSEYSADTFDLINEVLCAIDQTQYDAMVNKGDYLALIDMGQCSQSRDSASNAGQGSQDHSSNTSNPNYEKWYCNSSRLSTTTSQFVKLWIHEEGDQWEPEKTINGKIEITESVSDTNPYGLFTGNFIAYPLNSSSPMFKGFLKTEQETNSANVLLKFIVDGSFDVGGKSASFSEKAVLDRSADGASGKGSVLLSENWSGESKSFGFDIAFDNNFFLRKDTRNGGQTCLSRTSFTETAWRYGIYDGNGKRVSRNSGFPIKFTSDGQTYHGWVGYWGLWLPGEANVKDGDTVTKFTYGASAAETLFTVTKKGGKLKKFTKNTTTLDKIKNIPLDWYDNSNNTNYRVKWNGSNFVRFAQLNQGNWFWQNIPESNIDLTSLPFGEMNFWSQAIGGQVRVQLPNCTWIVATAKTSCGLPTGSTNVIYFTEDIVYPGDTVPASLRCYDNCPKYDASNGVVQQTNNFSPNFGGFNYTFNSVYTDMILKDSDGNPLVKTSLGNQDWGFMSGPIFEPTAANLALLACDWDASQTCGWKAWSALSTYYTWETGPNQWNQLTVLRDSSNTIQKFDPPLQLEYNHTQTDSTTPDYKYNGAKFYLEYSGFGDLHGIPGVCVDMDTGAATECGAGTNIRWAPEFLIPAGSTATAGGITYYIKPLELEQRMKSVALPQCSHLTLTSYALPDLSLWTDPNIGPEPIITGGPAVVGGVVQ